MIRIGSFPGTYGRYRAVAYDSYGNVDTAEFYIAPKNVTITIDPGYASDDEKTTIELVTAMCSAH